MNGYYSRYEKIGFLLGPLLFLGILLFPIEIINPLAHKVIAVAAWMICWWITEAVSIPITALLPLVLFPLTGILEIKDVAANYGSPIVFLFFGGFIIALAIEKVNLHRRIALNIIKFTGTNADGVVLGFMIATALMSMWISNTASTVVMLPIALSVVRLLIDDADGFTKNDQNFALSIMLGIAFAANIGGMATLIGTPPNVVMLGILNDEFNIEIGFFQWMTMGVPFAIVLLTIAYFVIVKLIYPNRLGVIKSSSDLIEGELQKLGELKKEEKIVLTIFLSTALLWVFGGTIRKLFPELNLNDTVISVLGAIAMLVAPTDFAKGEKVLRWKDTSKLPWGILILFGGGLALAQGMSESGIIDMIGSQIQSADGISIFWITALLIFVMLFMTELMSNVALTLIFIPVVAGIAVGLDVDALYLVIPVTLAASCAFMLPMATPPNAIVFASGYVKVYEMAKVGIILNVISVLLLIGLAYLVVPLIF